MASQTSSLFFLTKLFSLFISLANLCSFSSAASSSPYADFIQCLSQYPIPQAQVSAIVYTPGNASYNSVLQAYIRNKRFSTSSTLKPTIIVTPRVESHVQATVLCTQKVGLQLKIRSGGHDYEGISYVSNDPFIILDMFNFRDVAINLNDETAWVGAGATLGEFYYRIWEKSPVLGFPGGVCSTVGVGGHISGGGYGNMLRKFGLTVDHVLDAKIVDVNGKLLDRSGMGEDLFWAIKGGGGASFGVILSYKVQLVRVPAVVTYFRVEKFMEENAGDLLYKWQNVAADTIDDDLFIRILVQPVTAKKKTPKEKSRKTIRVTFIGMFLGDSNRLISLLGSQFPELGLKKQDCSEMSWIKSVLTWGFDNATSETALLSRAYDSNFLKRKSDYVVKAIPRDGLDLLFQKMIQLGKPGLVFNPYGGKMAELPESDTPFPHRAGIKFKIQYSVNWNQQDQNLEKQYLSQIRELYSFMTPYVSQNPRQAYLNYRDLDIGTTDNGKTSYDQGKVYGNKYFKGNFDRLVQIKTKVDPKNFFRNEQSIPTAPITSRKGGL